MTDFAFLRRPIPLRRPLPVTGLLARLRASRSGIALTEFAISLPIFVTLLFGGLEIISLVMAHMRMSQVAISVADNAGRVRTKIDEADIYEVFAGANLVGGGDFHRDARVILSSLEPNKQTGSRAGQMITWQRCYGALPVSPRYGAEGTGKNDNSLALGMGSLNSRIRAAEGTAVMFAEVSYRYTPRILPSIVSNGIDLRYESAFNVRERNDHDISNIQRLATNAC
ncbi:hypothetical protein A3711_00280 [Erythrobacter sp. HI00D59]|nr:hypothetical protein A3711_00280 [Erythrobacter sp. HI00D59]